MADLSSMSDDDLKAAYAQSDVSSLSDDDLKAEYQKSLDTAPTPSVDEYGRPVAGSSPEMDQYIGNSSIGHVLDAVGHGLKQGWGADEIVHPDTADALKKAGVLPDVEKGQTGIIRGFNEALLRPAAAGLDLAIRAGGQVIRGIGAGIAGIQAGIAQTGEEAGAPQLGRDVAGMFEAFPAGPMHEMGIPHAAPLDLGVARTEGVLGTEKQWKGIEAPTEDFPAGTVTHYSVPTMTIRAGEDGAEGMKPYAPTLSPDMQPPTEAPAPANVHEAARQVAPDTFREYDDLAESRQQLSDTIAAQSEGLRQSAEMQAPHAAEIADLEARLQDTTPRLAKKYRERLDALSPERDAFLADDFTMSALSRDTPEVTAMRQQLQEIDYRMRDLAPDVSAAYREAGKQFPEPVAEAPAQAPEAAQPAPQPEPQPVAEAAQPQPEAAQPTAALALRSQRRNPPPNSRRSLAPTQPQRKRPRSTSRPTCRRSCKRRAVLLRKPKRLARFRMRCGAPARRRSTARRARPKRCMRARRRTSGPGGRPRRPRRWSWRRRVADGSWSSGPRVV